MTVLPPYIHRQPAALSGLRLRGSGDGIVLCLPGIALCYQVFCLVELFRCRNSQNQAPASSREGKHCMGTNAEVQSITILLLVFIERR
jgi:hypothetical protein